MIKQLLAGAVVVLGCASVHASVANFNALTTGSSYMAPAIFSNGGLDFELFFSLGPLNVSAVSGQPNPAFNGNYLRLSSNTGLNVNLPTGASQIQFDFIRNSPATALVVNGGWVDVNALPTTVNGISVTNVLPTGSNWGSMSVTGDIRSFYFVGTEFLVDNLNTTELPGIPGDYSRNQVVDAADFVLLRKTFFSTTGYNSWRKNFGTAGVATVSASIPEPGAMALVAVGMCCAAAKNGRRRPA